jgi:hypothetical protein
VVLGLILKIWVCRHIIPYIRKYGKNPVTGAPLKQEDLIPLTFHKNSDGLYLCLCILVHLLFIQN